MAQPLPRLRSALDVLPSPDRDRPGLLLRDPFRYTDAILYVPPAWAMTLGCLDGQHTGLDVQELLTRMTGQLVFSSEVQKFVGLLSEQGFLETEEFERLRARRHAEFAEASERQPAHAGSAYPAAPADVRNTFAQYFAPFAQCDGLHPGVIGVAAPHVSPEGGRDCYAAAYARLAAHPGLTGRTFVILGTSHYGQPQKFGLTRKPFVTPLGSTRVDVELVGWLEQRAPEAITTEDYCHSIEHSIEFQCVFLQHLFGPQITILPILCGPFADSLITGRPPEGDTAVARFFDALGEMAERQASRLFWVLGIDMAHMGRRYGHEFHAVAMMGEMASVAEQDRRRMDAVVAGDAAAFFDLVKRNGDELSWCGYPPLYTFLKAVPRARGRVLRYEQWNIDPQSVVTFAGLEFFATEPQSHRATSEFQV